MNLWGHMCESCDGRMASGELILHAWTVGLEEEE